MKRFIILGYLLFFIFSIIVIEKTLWLIIISLILLYPIYSILHKMSYNEVEELFLFKKLKNKFPNHPLFR